MEAYSFTSAPIAKALLNAHKRAVGVEVILDKSQLNQDYTSATFFFHEGIPVRINDKHAIAHNKVPHVLLFPLILLFCLIGVHRMNNSALDIYIMILFGVIGYLMQKFGFEPAPLALAYVLSPMLEMALRQSLNMSGGSFFIFLSRPISRACLLFVAGLLAFQIYSYFQKKGPIIPT